MLWIKALHIVFVVTWFAGLFYIVRLFIYHAEALALPAEERNILVRQYKIMERRLWYGITWPSLVLVWTTGVGYAIFLFGLQWPSWLLLKFGLVIGLTVYHLICHRMFTRFQQDIAGYTSFFLRLWNEVTTLFLLAIVLVVVLRQASAWLWGSLVAVAGLLLLAVFLYRKRRNS